MPTPGPGQAEAELLPDAVVMAMLKRELLLTRAKLHALTYEHIMGERKMRQFKSQLKQVGDGPVYGPALSLGACMVHCSVPFLAAAWRRCRPGGL